MSRPLGKLYIPIFGLICLGAQASDEFHGLCKDVPTYQTNQQATSTNANTSVEFTANRVNLDESGIITLEGDAKVTRGAHTVDADLLRYNESEEKVYASGNVRAEDDQLIVETQEAELHLQTDYVKTGEAIYRYKPLHARGSADSIEQTSEDLRHLENATYTTCDKGDHSWILSASEIKLDKTSGDGTGKNVVVNFKGVPFFYTPWIRFPLDDRRKSGFLTPAIGNSSDSGFELATPWYWNIAPHRDAILTPRLLTDRGLQVKSHFRYLDKKSTGQLGLEYLDDHEFDDDRYLVSFRHKSNLSTKLKLNFLYNKTSDKNYFEDLGDTLKLTSTHYIKRLGELHYHGKHWRFLTRAQDFQTINDSLTDRSKPLRRLPQLKLNGNYSALPGGFSFSSESEWVSFEHEDKTDGDRLHLGIELERPFERAGYFIRPGIRLTHTEYDLNRDDENHDDKPSRSMPSAYMDAGLIFERDLEKSGNVQTLEPRLYYLHTPFRNQSDIPIFDTSEYEFGFEQLFRKNRFSGNDRVGDADQLSVGVTTRVLDSENGREKLRASLGRIFYFRDRKVVLPGKPVQREDSSETVAELKIGLGDRWQAIASAVWDTHDDHTKRSSVQFRYRSKNDLVLNMAYRYRHKDLEQSDVSMVLPINDHWRTVARWNYDFREKQALELLAGIEYDTCCWKIRLVGRRYNQNTDRDHNESIELQLVLKGLARIGSPIGELLERNIRGYDDQDDEYLF